MKNIKKILCASALAVTLIGLSACSFVGKTIYRYPNQDQYVSGDRKISDEIKNININYISGEITIITDDTSSVSIKEECKKDISEEMKVCSYVDGDTLYVRFCRSGHAVINNLDKHLTLVIPNDHELKELNIDATSADIKLSDINTKKTKINTVSGDIEGRLNASDLDINTVSGEATLESEYLDNVDADSTSGDFTLNIKKTPKMININSTSGNLILYLPKDLSLSADIDTVSGDVIFDQSFKLIDDRYVFGDGESILDADTTSGDIIIKEISK